MLTNTARTTVLSGALLILLMTSSLAAQLRMRPTDPPLVTAANESWYLAGEPILINGDLYYRAGSAVFFDGDTMARSGYYNGVPLYVDVMVEPFSLVLVPVRSGLMQPYERRRRGDIAGSTGSRTPGFPVSMTTASTSSLRSAQGASAFSSLPLPIGAVSSSELRAPARPIAVPIEPVVPVETSIALRPRGQVMASILQPESNDGVWVHFQGSKWVSAGAAVPLQSSEFRAAGTYDGFPLFVRNNEEKTIYLPSRDGLVAPYKQR